MQNRHKKPAEDEWRLVYSPLRDALDQKLELAQVHLPGLGTQLTFHWFF